MIEVGSDCRLVFCVGIGGVGKTTFSAALAVREAIRGRSVLLLTADPARRLADALGIHDLSNRVSTVTLPVETRSGELHAAMLETKDSADAIIARAAEDEDRAQRVLDNRIYQAFSTTLARSHAYAAMERVHEAFHDSRYDLIIVDTPPAQSAMEILDAPARLVRFLDQRVVRWFLQPAGETHKLRGGALTRRLLSTIAGDSLVSALTDFLSEMAFLREGFATRAKELRDAMRSSQTEFILVSSADAIAVESAQQIASEVAARDFVLGQVVFNRAFISELEAAHASSRSLPPGLEDLEGTLVALHQWLADDQDRKQAAIDQFVAEHNSTAWLLPESTRALADRSALFGWISAVRPYRPRA